MYDAQDQIQTAASAIQNLNLTSASTRPNTSSNSSGKRPSGSSGGGGTQIITGGAGSGSGPGGQLNVTQVLGVLAQAQRSFIPEYTSVPILADPISQNGALISVNGILYRFNGDVQPGTWEVQAGIAAFLIDTYANWTMARYDPASYPVGVVFVIEDWTNVTYIVQLVMGVHAWVYYSGTYRAAIADLPTTGFDGAVIGSDDSGLTFHETTWNHVLQWDTTTNLAWDWGPGEPGSGMGPVLFEIDPAGLGWHLYDGTASVPYLKADGTTGTVNLPDLTSSGALAAFLKGGGTNSGPTAAIAPTISGHTELALTGISVSGGSGATSGTGAADNTGTSSIAVLTPPLAGGGGGGAVTDPMHQHNLTSGNAPISATGEPRKLVRRPWFRQ